MNESPTTQGENAQYQTISQVQIGGIVGIVVTTVILLLIGSVWIYKKWNDKNYKDTIFSRFEKFADLSFSQITITLVIAFLIAAVINSFNNAIIVPIIQAVFPNNIWTDPVPLIRGANMYPGMFFLSLISFLLSIVILFILAEILFQLFKILYRTPLSKTITNSIFMLLFLGLFLGIIGWNIYDIVEPENKKVIPPNTYRSMGFF